MQKLFYFFFLYFFKNKTFFHIVRKMSSKHISSMSLTIKNLQLFERYMNDNENEADLSIRSGRTISSDDSSTYIKLQHVLFKNKHLSVNHQIRNQRLLWARNFNSTLNYVAHVKPYVAISIHLTRLVFIPLKIIISNSF